MGMRFASGGMRSALPFGTSYAVIPCCDNPSSDAACPAAYALQVNVKEAVELRDAIILSGGDLRQPQNLTTKMKAVTRDKEVNKSLFQMLSLKPVVRSCVV